MTIRRILCILAGMAMTLALVAALEIALEACR
jgi:hypothetical protein